MIVKGGKGKDNVAAEICANSIQFICVQRKIQTALSNDDTRLMKQFYIRVPRRK